MQSDPAVNGDAAVVPTSSLRPADVLVAVPALNEAAHIERCLISLIEGQCFMADVDVVVADGGSRDNTVGLVARLSRRFPQLRVIDNPGRLQSAAVNAVVSEAGPGHRYLIRCDAHAVYPAGYVQAVAESLAARPEAAAVATVMDATGNRCFQRAASWIVDKPLGSGGSAHRGGQHSGWVDHAHHAGFDLDWFRKTGGYDESFTHNEDAEFDHRLGLAGGRIWLDASIRLDYQMRDSLRGLWLQYWRYGQGRARNVLKHRMRPRLRQMLPVAAVLGIAASVAIGTVWPPALLLTALYLMLVAGTSIAGAAALKSPCGLWSGPAMAAMHLGWGLGFLYQVMISAAAR